VKEHPAPCNELVTFLKQRLSGVPSEDLRACGAQV
jgi:hypothetical protein